MLETVLIYGEDVCCSVVFDTLVGVSVFSVIWSELLMTSAISCPLWSSVYECQRVECAFTSDGWGGVMSLDYLYIWQVYVSVYCTRRIPAHLRCTQYSILCTLSISASYRKFVCGRYCKSRLVCVFVVGPGLVSTSPPFMRSTASHPAGPHGRLAQKR